jgi:hypothetical protein
MKVFASLVVLLTLSAMIVSASAESTPDTGQPSIQQGDTKAAQNTYCPRVWIETRDAFISNSGADHTYVKARHDSGQIESWGCFGNKDGGTELKGTKTDIREGNIQIIPGMVEREPCKWPWYYYLPIGVCHQLANRGLYNTGKTVAGARWYGFTSQVYGTYGALDWAFPKYSMENCLKSIGQWQDGAPPECGAAVKSSPKDAGWEKELFDSSMSMKGLRVSKGAFVEWFKTYMDALLMGNIRRRLGADFPQAKAMKIKGLHDEVLTVKYTLDKSSLERLSRTQTIPENIIDKYNNLFKWYLRQSREYLTQAEFERLFDMDSTDIEKKFDMRTFSADSLKK